MFVCVCGFVCTTTLISGVVLLFIHLKRERKMKSIADCQTTKPILFYQPSVIIFPLARQLSDQKFTVEKKKMKKSRQEKEN